MLTPENVYTKWNGSQHWLRQENYHEFKARLNFIVRQSKKITKAKRSNIHFPLPVNAFPSFEHCLDCLKQNKMALKWMDKYIRG